MGSTYTIWTTLNPQPLMRHTLLNSINGRPTDSKFGNPFACVCCPFLVRWMRSLSGDVRSIRWKVLCMLKTWNGHHRPKASAGCMVIVCWACVLVGTPAFPVLYLSVRIRFLIGGPDTRPDFYLIINGWTEGVPDIDRMCNGQIPTGNAWKLMNNGCVTRVHGTKLTTSG